LKKVTFFMKKDAIPPAAPYLIVVIGIAAVSTASLFIRYAQDYAPSITIAAFRMALAALLLFPYTVIKHKKELRSLSRTDLGLTLLAGFFLALHFATWITSLEYTSVASSVVLVTTTPLWVALMAPIFLKEKTPRIVVVGMIVALLGGGIITISDLCSWLPEGLSCQPEFGKIGSSSLLGDILAVLGAIFGAAYLMIGRHLRRKVHLTPYIFLVYSGAAVFLVITMFFMVGIPPVYPIRVYSWLVLLAVVPQLMGHTIFNWSLKYLPAGYVSVTLLGEPIGSTFLAYIFLNEKPPATKVIGAILILAGIGLASFHQKSQSANHSLQENQ
jgi:drug/metabolite transporter (DMT)-like permease